MNKELSGSDVPKTHESRAGGDVNNIFFIIYDACGGRWCLIELAVWYPPKRTEAEKSPTTL